MCIGIGNVFQGVQIYAKPCGGTKSGQRLVVVGGPFWGEHLGLANPNPPPPGYQIAEWSPRWGNKIVIEM